MNAEQLNKLKLMTTEPVRHSPADLLAYSYDGTPGFQAMPDAVVSPGSAEEVSDIVNFCRSEGIPIVPRGSGTNLSAGTTPTAGGIVMLFNRMNQILEIDEENLTIRVQPGLITKDLIEAVEAQGLFYPPDPSSMKISTIGGNISENSGGLRGLKYGVTKDYVLGLEAVMADGSIIRTGGKLAKDVAGYDLTKLLTGAEGTLGIVTEATLKLIPLPSSKQTMLAQFSTMDDAAGAVSTIISNRIIPATLEFMDRATIRAVEDFAKVGLPLEAEAILLIEQDGPEASVSTEMKLMQTICEQQGAFSVELASTAEEAANLMTARRSALSALARLKPTTILEDATVPRSKVAEMIEAINQAAEKHQVTICTFGHAGDGNLHPTCITDARNTDEMHRVEAAFEEIFKEAIRLGGTITGEHGVGEMKAPYLEWRLGASGINVMKLIKQALDPDNIMNPNKIFGKSEKKRVVVSR